MIRAGKERIQSGFMLVELLVVIAIIAILATIVMVGYSAVQNRTYDATVQADLASNAKILTDYIAKNSTYPTDAQLATVTNKLGFVKANYNVSVNAVLYCRSADGSKMSLIGVSKTGAVYYVTDTYRLPRTFGVSLTQVQSTDCTNSGVTDPSNGTSGGWIHTSAGGWDTWVK